MSLIEEADGWTSEALRTLEVAQQISSLAHSSLNSSNQTLTGELPRVIQESLSKYDMLLKHQALISSICKDLQATVLQLTEGHDKKVLSILQPALHDLDTVLETLHNITVPLFLVKGFADPKAVFRLDDFVALDTINRLKTNINIYLSNCDKTNSLLRKSLSNVLQLCTSKRNEHKHICTAYETQVLPVKPFLKYATAEVTSNKLSEGVVGTILKENNSLGLELTALLEMLTKHYDQCMLASNFVRGTRDEAVDIDVLRSDTLELPSVLKEVRAIYDIISHNERRALSFTALKIPPLEAFCDQCHSFLDSCSALEANEITELLVVLAHSQIIYGRSSLSADVGPDATAEQLVEQPVEDYASVVTELCNHYRHFCSVYQVQYLSELHYEQFVYPRKFYKLLDNYLNGQLVQLEDEERERRREWLRRYGDFIPGDLYLPGEAEQPRVVQVVSEGLDHLESASAQDAEDRLVNLLKETRLLRGYQDKTQ